MVMVPRWSLCQLGPALLTVSFSGGRNLAVIEVQRSSRNIVALQAEKNSVVS